MCTKYKLLIIWYFNHHSLSYVIWHDHGHSMSMLAAISWACPRPFHGHARGRFSSTYTLSNHASRGMVILTRSMQGKMTSWYGPKTVWHNKYETKYLQQITRSFTMMDRVDKTYLTTVAQNPNMSFKRQSRTFFMLLYFLLMLNLA